MCASVAFAPSPAQTSEAAAEQARIDEHLPQVRRIARSIHSRVPRHVALEDLVQAGVLGLIDAVQKFDSGKHVQFGAYAAIRIRGAIVDSLRQLDWAPRELRKQARRMEDCELRLYSRLGRVPEEAEIAREMRISVKEYRSLRAELDQLEIASLDEPASGEEFSDVASQPCDAAASPYEDCRREEVKRLLADAIHELPQRERSVLALYYFEELTMKEVGRVMGVDESRVSQIHSAAIARLRARVQATFNQAALCA